MKSPLIKLFLLFTVLSFLGATQVRAEETLDCKPEVRIQYKGNEFCPEFNPFHTILIADRNKFGSLLNLTQQSIQRLHGNILGKTNCIKLNLDKRSSRVACMSELYKALGILNASKEELNGLKRAVQPLNMPQSLKDNYAQSLRTVINKITEKQESISKSIEVGQKELIRSALRQSDKRRREGANDVFCRSLSARALIQNQLLVAMMRGSRVGDTHVIYSAFNQLKANRAYITRGYTLCGYEEDETFQKLQKTFDEANAIFSSTNVKRNLAVICKNPAVRKHIDLVNGCNDPGPVSEGFLYSLHAAITGRYQQESKQ